jgi:hypothetical protein
MQGLDDIEAKLEDGHLYDNMWDFLTDLHILTSTRVKDYHFGVLVTLYGLFKFDWGVQLVSVSQDGRKVPQIFLRGTARPASYSFFVSRQYLEYLC